MAEVLDNSSALPGRHASAVVVVESDSTLRQFIGRVATQCARRVMLIESAAEMSARVAEQSECIVVYDTYAGREPLLTLRQQFPLIPIILLLSPSSTSSHDLSSAVGPVATLSIPFRPQDLEQALLRAVSQLRGGDEPASGS
jgi:CheY-like chemotaxis protein